MQDDSMLMRMSDRYQISQILKTNEDSKEYGLVLTEEDASLLALQRKDALRNERRVEFGEGIMPKLIRTFCDSSFIEQDTYAETLARLQDIFYLYKNESLDLVSDDELLIRMKEAFEEGAGGALDYLEGTALEAFAREIRAGENWADRYKKEKLMTEDDYD